MPTIVYLVHGMGCGTADGKPAGSGAKWSDTAVEAIRWIADTYKIPQKPIVLDPIPDKPPAGSEHPNAIWVVPVSYHAAFDDFRRGADDRKAAVAKLRIANLTDAHVTDLTTKEFLWKNCLDVLLWWADTAEARPHATTKILATIASADDLAHKVRGSTIRRVLISHSLGTAAATYALRQLGVSNVWPAIGGFDYWATLANVAPFLMATDAVYAPPLLPGVTGTLVRWMCNVHHEADPIPWLLPWRHWDASNAGSSKDAWLAQAADGNLTTYQTVGVAAPKSQKPTITDVHGFANYLMATDVARELAGVMRGAAYDDQEIAALNPAAAWKALPQLTCTKTQTALAELAEAKKLYIQAAGSPPVDPVLATAGWFERLLRAADILLAAEGKC